MNILGEYLIFSLQRFNPSLNTKNNVLITFEETLDLKNIYDEIEELNKDNIYKLWSTVDHFGSIENGHYTTNIKINNFWYVFNDEEITNININLCSSSVVMLIYKRLFE